MKKTSKKKSRNKLFDILKDPNYMDVKKCAEFLDISVSHLYTLTSKRKIPHIKMLGKKLIFERDKIYKWIKSKEVIVK